MSHISPLIDIAFKKIFGVEENKDLLISLINAVVSPDDQISEVVLLNPYNPRNFMYDKLSILDIKASNREGKKFNIEIQITDEADYDKRALYYWAKLYTEQLKKGDSYCTLSKAIGIHILNFTSIPDSEKYHNVFRITEDKKGFFYFKDLELHTIELKKFSGRESNILDDLLTQIHTALDLWVAFLTRHDLLKTQNNHESHLQKAFDVLEVMGFTDEEREAYEGRLKWFQIEASTLGKAEERGEERGIAIGQERGIAIGQERGIAIGQERGIVIGQQQGIAIGEERGKREQMERMVINLLLEKADFHLICQISGLSKEEVKKIWAHYVSLLPVEH